ncbi:S-layer homology domain-containing protein [Lysinibacillus yapensis]|uniref:S-layer homology domain-containing protein n=1 Tax=Ureibacillus yapensis TaxID=2304605 RepID=A0A396S3D4_9BACL|nr:S-layer homology domain-containing protein [Lysinibacillus yapensis]RHW32730.1 S-layer homology domain-containing protein [Lysinibacillus yapensis]
MKALYGFLTLIVAFGFFAASPTFAAEKSIDQYFLDDVDYEHWAYNALERFLYADIIDGYAETEKYEEDGEEYEYTYVSIKPNNSITRAEFTKILVNAMNLREDGKGKTFSDVKPSSWYSEYVNIAGSHGIIQGKTADTFGPNDKITRVQMAVMIYRAFQPTIDFSASGKAFADVPQEHFAYEAVIKTAAKGIIKGKSNGFKPRDNATRAEAIVMIDRSLHLEPGTGEDQTAAMQTVDRNIKDEAAYSVQEDYEALKTLYRETTTGYHLAYSLDSLGLSDMIEEDREVAMEQIGEYTINPVSVNKQFAEVRVDGLEYKVSMTAPKMSLDMTVDLSGTASLKKSEDGKWKIYNVVFDEEVYGEDWTETIATEVN